MSELQKITAAVEALNAAGCRRVDGVWTDKDGRELASEPLTALRVLKRETVAAAVRKHESEGRCFTR